MVDHAFSPAGPLNRLTSYWYATWMRLLYRDDRAAHTQTLMDLIGATDRTVWATAAPVAPEAELLTLPGDRGILGIRGTTIWQEYVLEAIGSVQVPSVVWSGAVSLYFSTVASNVAAALGPLPSAWIAAGHSLGGAVASLLVERMNPPPDLVWDIASPRVGNATHAAAQVASQTTRLRLTNQNDPVPHIPPSTNSVLDHLPLFLLPPIPPVSAVTYRHWGSRVQLLGDGSALRPPTDYDQPGEAVAALIAAINGSLEWQTAHDTTEYARRLRMGMDPPWPLAVPDPDFPGLVELDGINLALNESEGVEWLVTGALRPAVVWPQVEGTWPFTPDQKCR